MGSAGEDWAVVLSRLLAGDRVALAQVNRLVTSQLTHLRAYDFRDEWDDLRQEVLAAVIANAKAGRLRDPQAFAGYVKILTRNKFIDRLKGRLRHHERDALPWDEETAAAADLEPADHRTAEVWSAAGTLGDDEQRILHGIYREGKTYEQVSHDTGIPLGTLKRRLREALEHLRRQLVEDPS